MPGSTPARGIPYPSPTDPINAYPALAQSAAGILDTHGHSASDVSGLSINSIPGLPDALRARLASPFPQAAQLAVVFDRVNVALGNEATGTVTLPTGFATVAAVLTQGIQAGGVGAPVTSVLSISANSFQILAFRPSLFNETDIELCRNETIGVSYLVIGT